MATVTGGGATTFINVGSNDTANAQNLANVISAALATGTDQRVTTPNSNPPTGFGVLTIGTTGTSASPNVTVNQPAVSVDLINAAGGAVGTSTQVVIGSGLPNQQVIADSENITYFTNGGGGTMIFGDGNDVVGTPTVGGGALSVRTGTGNDTINIFSGNATVSATTGNNVINTGQPGNFSAALIFAEGNDRILSSGGSGTDTVIGGNGSIFISEATKNLVFNGQGGTAPVTVQGGAGSYIVTAGVGGGVIAGGAAGNNRLYGGNGAAGTTLFGGGNGDILFARGTGAASFLIAGTGNETLTGAGSSVGNIYASGLGGNTTIGGGAGNDTIFSGDPGTTSPFGGSIVADGGLGNDLFSFTNRGSGVTASVLINNFHTGAGDNDQIQLIGFATSQQAAIASAAASAGTVTLSDGTKLTFGTAASLTGSNFA